MDDKFCDAHCTWRDHHPECKRAEPDPVYRPGENYGIEGPYSVALAAAIKLDRYALNTLDIIAANEHAVAVEQQLLDAQARVAELEAALERAREMVSDWASYTSEYFRQKHDLAGCLAWLDAEIAGTKERIGKDQP